MNDTSRDEIQHYLGQMLDDDCARVIHDAMLSYAAITLGRDRGIAQQIAELFDGPR